MGRRAAYGRPKPLPPVVSRGGGIGRRETSSRRCRGPPSSDAPEPRAAFRVRPDIRRRLTQGCPRMPVSDAPRGASWRSGDRRLGGDPVRSLRLGTVRLVPGRSAKGSGSREAVRVQPDALGLDHGLIPGDLTMVGLSARGAPRKQSSAQMRVQAPGSSAVWPRASGHAVATRLASLGVHGSARFRLSRSFPNSGSRSCRPRVCFGTQRMELTTDF